MFHSHAVRRLLSTLTLTAFVVVAGCAVTRGQETVGAYIDDTAITSSVKARYVGNKEVDATSIHVETLNGAVMLSGFAKSITERGTAESIARGVSGVKTVQNRITVQQ